MGLDMTHDAWHGGCADCQPATPSGTDDRWELGLRDPDGAELWRKIEAGEIVQRFAFPPGLMNAIHAPSLAALQEARDGCAAALVSEQRLLAEVAALREATAERDAAEMKVRLAAEWFRAELRAQKNDHDARALSLRSGADALEEFLRAAAASRPVPAQTEALND